ncbi:MAG TPA: hypothetical protein EYG78_07775 [Sulfurovum sp.]|nr:hypothetical protein [Sulfurovum sp.]
MMKKMLVATATLSLVLFTGCSQKEATPSGAGTHNISDASAITGDTVSINESGSAASGNSSADGFASVYFDFGIYTVSSNMETKIRKNVSLANNTSQKIKIEGNCDEFGTDEYNYALGLKRAKAVKDALVSNGVNASRVVIVSFGESNPVCSSPSDSCYAKNRRVDLRLIK